MMSKHRQKLRGGSTRFKKLKASFTRLYNELKIISKDNYAKIYSKYNKTRPRDQISDG